ncbi:hypothetical protein HY498_04245 [Candidatus Woesearchaeota archaeon]|nr:hypothetical protein [Candidatus Woesearchaeota archaeon]
MLNEIDKETIMRVVTFFNIASLKCSCCGELGEHIDSNKDIKIITKAEFYGIKNIKGWEERMDKELIWIKNNKEKVLSILPEIEQEWGESCKIIQQVLS